MISSCATVRYSFEGRHLQTTPDITNASATGIIQDENHEEGKRHHGPNDLGIRPQYVLYPCHHFAGGARVGVGAGFRAEEGAGFGAAAAAVAAAIAHADAERAYAAVATLLRCHVASRSTGSICGRGSTGTSSITLVEGRRPNTAGGKGAGQPPANADPDAARAAGRLP